MAQQQPTIFDLPKVLAVGVASPAAAAITSRLGIAGTLIGLALSSIFITAAVDFLKVHLARVPGAVSTIPGGFRKRSSLRNVFERMRRPFSKSAPLARPRRRSILIGSTAAAGISFIIGLIVVQGLAAVAEARAARLLGATEALLEAAGVPVYVATDHDLTSV